MNPVNSNLSVSPFRLNANHAICTEGRHNNFTYSVPFHIVCDADNSLILLSAYVVELKKQSSCLVQLENKSDQYVAFKVWLLIQLVVQYILDFFVPLVLVKICTLQQCLQSSFFFSGISLHIIYEYN